MGIVALSLSGLKVSWLRQALRIMERKPAPKTIPMSGDDRLRDRDYSFARFRKKNTGEVFLFKHLVGPEQAFGRFWLKDQPYPDDGIEQVFDLSDLSSFFEIEIEQFFAEIQIVFKSAKEFALYHYLDGAWLRLLWSRLRRWQWSRRTIVRNQRIDILRYLVEKYETDGPKGISAERLIADIHGDSWWYTKKAMRDHSYYRLLLKSLVDSEDVREMNGYYVLPQSLATLAAYELEERRFREASQLQQWIIWLTVILALTGIAQVVVAALTWRFPAAR